MSTVKHSYAGYTKCFHTYVHTRTHARTHKYFHKQMIFNTNFSYSENTVRSMTAADDTIHNQWIGSGLK